MKDISAIPVFIMVIEQSSFSKAADKLGITKSAVSKRISGLESHLGVKLIYRSTRKLSLTEAGERYLIYAQQALIAAQKAEDAAAQLQNVPHGLLKVNVPMSFGRLHIAPLIPDFLREYPQIKVHLDMNDRWSGIIPKGFDITLQTGELPNSSLICKKLAMLNSVLCASPRYIEKYGKPKNPRELVSHNCILSTHHSVVGDWVFIKDGEEEVIQVEGNYQVNNGEALYEALLQGTGIGRLPTFISKNALEKKQLVPLLTEFQMPSKALYAVFPERKFMPEKVRIFIEFLVAKLSNSKVC